MQSQVTIGQAMGAASKVMGATNKQFSAAKMQETMMQFERQSTEMDFKQELSMFLY